MTLRRPGLPALLCAAALAWPALSGAQPAAPAAPAAAGVEKPEQQIEVFKRVKPGEAGGEEKAGPRLRGEDVLRVYQTQAQAKRDEAIRTLEEIIRSTSAEDPQLADYLFRLSEQYWGKAHFFHLRAFAADDQIWETEKTDPARHEQLKRMKQEDLSRSEQFREKAIEVYKQIIRDYPTFAKLDQVLFYLGFNYKEKGDSEAAQKIFTMLIKKYPSSEFIPDTLLAFGEYFFEINEVESALRFYEKASKYTESKVYGFALYKMGWCYYNLARYDKAMEKFIQVIRYSETAAGQGDANRITLLKEAQGDLVRTYSHIGSGSKAIAFFQKVIPVGYVPLAKKLADIYANEGKGDESSDLYRQLIKLDPNDPEIVSYQFAITRNTEKGGNKEATVTEVKRLVKLYRAFNEKGALPEPRKSEIGGDIQDLLRDLATTWHREAQVTKNDLYLAYAYSMYKEYVETFPQAKDIYLMTFYFAELLYKIAKWDEAAKYYEKVIEIDPKGKFAQEAAHATVLAYQKLLNVGERRETRAAPVDARTDGKQTGASAVPAAKEISGPQKRFIDACDRYTKMVPDGDRIVDVKYFVALTYYDYNQFDEAISRFLDLIENHSGHRLALYAANLVLDAYNLKQDYEGLNRSVETFLGNKQIARGEFLDTLMTLREGAAFKSCLQLEEHKRYKEAAEGFQKFITDFPTSQFYDKALYNAALDYERVNDIASAIKARLRLIRERPDSELVPKSLYAIAGNFHASAVYSQAAQSYEFYAERYPTTPEAELSLANAAVFRQGLGDDERAIANYRKWLELYGTKKPKQAASVQLTIAKIFLDRKAWPKALDEMRVFEAKYMRHASDDEVVLARTRMGLLFKSMGKPGPAAAAFEQAVKAFNAFPEARRRALTDGREAAAQARYEQGEAQYAAFLALPMNSSKKLVEQVNAKKKQMVVAQQIYVTVIDYGHPNWTIAATARIGQGWQDLADAIRKAPPPKGLSAEELEVYQDELDQKAVQFEEGAVKFYSRCLELAAQYKWFNEFTVKAEHALAKLDPQKFQPINEVRSTPIHSGQTHYAAGYVSEVQ